jgi:hypothetical protein
LHELLFIKDGPLAFYGPPSALQQPMRALVRYLHAHHALYLAGLEKSGGFVEHADAIADLLPAGSLLLLDSDYVYRYILPGRAHLRQPYGHRTYYGHKLVFKAPSGALYVVTVPTGQVQRHPALKDYPNLPVVLTNLAKLQCDMYDSALVPVALVNQLVSLSQHPSTRILQRFAKEQVGSR